jgi:hypothetical protein
MSNPSNLWSAFRQSTPEHWRSAAKWFAYTVGCGFLPVMFGLLVVLALSRQFKLDDFIVHGEFVLYSAALITSAVRLITKDTDTFPFVHRELFALTALIAILSAVGLYTVIKTATLLKLESTVDNAFIRRFSMPLLVFSLIFSFVVFLLDQQRIFPNIRGIVKLQEDQLKADFDKLGKPDEPK